MYVYMYYVNMMLYMYVCKKVRPEFAATAICLYKTQLEACFGLSSFTFILSQAKPSTTYSHMNCI